MASIKEAFAASTATSITCGMASLANGSARESNWVDNTTNLYLDALVQVKVKTNASAPSGNKQVIVYAGAITDPTTPVYPDAMTGADGTITLNSPTQLKPVAVIFTPSASTTYIAVPFSIAQAFGGVLPQKWGLAVYNDTGNAFDTTAGNFLVAYQGYYLTVA